MAGAFTARGQAMRERIIAAAADLMFERGALGTSLDDVRAATGVSKSQLYHYFANKSALIQAVIERQTDRVLDAQRPVIERLDSWDALHAWRDLLVDIQRQRQCRGGCPIGSLANELAEANEPARLDLVKCFERWQAYLIVGLTAMRGRGDLRRDADPETLALAIMASLQGGLLLTEVSRTTRPLEVALDAALAHARTYGRRRRQ